MNKGTFEGDLEEIRFVKKFNSSKQLFLKYFDYLGINDVSNYWMVRVTSKQLSMLSNQRVFTRADAYLVFSLDLSLEKYIKDNDYYLTENDLLLNSFTFSKISFSGVSVKMADSKSFQIIKIGPASFKKLFGSYELGCGASMFCLKEQELVKNEELFLGWNTSISNMADYYCDIINGDSNFYLNQDICKIIKTYSCEQIKNMIINSKDLKEKIFNGKGLYKEPYTAWHFYHGDCLELLVDMPFNVTTGSGRSHGDYTIVLKPAVH